MPKLKTHKGTAKRVKITGTGKIMRARRNHGHFLEKKSESSKRVMATPAEITGKNARNIKRALGV